MRCKHASPCGRGSGGLTPPDLADLGHHEVAKRLDATGLAQLLGVGEEHRHLVALDVGQHPHERGLVFGHVVGQHAHAEAAQDALHHAEVVVDVEHVAHPPPEQVLHQARAGRDLDRGRMLADEAVVADRVEAGRRAAAGDVVARGEELHPDGHEALAHEVGLRGLLHAHGDVGLAHRQVDDALLQHQVDVEVGVALVEPRQPRHQPQRAEAHGGRHAELAQNLLLAVADARGGGVEALGHRGGGVEQKLPLLGQNQAARVAVEERGAERVLERADLAADGRLAQMQHVPGMRERARRRDGVEDPELVPIHGDAFAGRGRALPEREWFRSPT